MNNTIINERTHQHHFSGSNNQEEKKTWIVIAITAIMMVAEIFWGIVFFSMALLTDGWHKGTLIKDDAKSSCLSSACSGFGIQKKCDTVRKLPFIMSLGLLIMSENLSAQALETEAVEPKKESPIEFNAAITGDFGSNFSGGLEQGSAYLGNIDVTATLSTEKANLWGGGTFFVYFLNNHGESLSQYVGDLQGVDNIEANNHSRLYQFWYKQEFANLSITVGQHDLNSEFCGSEYGASFINSSFGIQPDISTNVPVSIFPVATLGAILNFKVTHDISVLAAVYDGNPGDQDTNPNSLDIRLNKNEGTISIFELQHQTKKDSVMIGSQKVGAWSHNIDNHFGIYVIIDQKLRNEKKDKNQGLGFFTQAGLSPNRHSYVDFYYSFGFHYTGLIKGRDEDILGLAINNLNIAKNYRNENPSENLSDEKVIELTYSAHINDFLTIHPDLQYVIKPGGSASVKNALVGILRLVAEF